MHRFKNEDLFNIWLAAENDAEKFLNVFTFITEQVKDDMHVNTLTIKAKVQRLCQTFRDRWTAASRRKDYFLTKNVAWLQKYCIIETDEPSPSTSSGRGRPKLPYAEKSLRSKRKEASLLSQEKAHEAPLIVKAAEIAARKNKQRDLADMLKEINKSPSRPTKIRKLVFSPTKDILSYTPEQALELILNSNFSKQQYLDIRQGAILRNCNMYPDYKKIWKCKVKCRPTGITVTDIVATVPLANLLEHTAQRIVLLQEEVIIQYMESLKTDEISVVMLCSYGFDGSSGQSVYKQSYDTPGLHSDTSLFATTCVPLRLLSENAILWNNRTPQSTRFCRPVKLEYVKETKNHVLKEKNNFDKQIEQLADVKITLPNNKIIVVQFKVFMTLVDGKILNILTGTSSQACPICGGTPKDFYKLENIQSTHVFDPKPNTLHYGISPLHAWIRFFECILHISYRKDLGVWQVRGATNQQILKDRKHTIQDRFLTELHLHVDKPKAGGFGSTNDGNTARRAFADTKKFSEITDFDEQLIKKFKTILICLSCQFQVDFEKFDKYCTETAKEFLLKYPWYPMPATVHKILVHGKQIIESSALPVGYLGEEGSEARNKLYKYDRLFHARKSSRQKNLDDVFHRAMDTSDPVISSINLEKRIKRQKKLQIPSEVMDLLSCELTFSESEETEEKIEDSEDDQDESDENEDEENVITELIPTIYHLDVIELENETYDEC